MDLARAAVLVTGGRGGIRRALVDAFATAGATPLSVDLARTDADHEMDVPAKPPLPSPIAHRNISV